MADEPELAPQPNRELPAVVAPPVPPADWSGAWAELGGYVQEAADSGTLIDAVALLAYMRELKSRALLPVKEWMDELRRSASE